MAFARRIVLLGAPGSGKGTQSELLAERFGFEVISTGARLRDEVESGSPLGQKVAGIMAAGKLVADELMTALVGSALSKLDPEGRFVLDGFPRTTAQAEALDRLLGEHGTHLDSVLYFEVPDEELVRRLISRGRNDDSEAVVRERLRVFTEQTRPLVAWYDQRSILRRIWGLGEVEEVAARVATALEL